MYKHTSIQTCNQTPIHEYTFTRIHVYEYTHTDTTHLLTHKDINKQMIHTHIQIQEYSIMQEYTYTHIRIYNYTHTEIYIQSYKHTSRHTDT